MSLFTGNEPIFIQIADQIRQQILSSTLQEGEQVMSTTQYSQTYRINPATAGKAFNLLVDEGLLEKRRGLGMFVCEGAKAQLQQEGKEIYAHEVLEPTLEQGLQLGVSKQDLTNMVQNYLNEANR